jgi:hypothetical protein
VESCKYIFKAGMHFVSEISRFLQSQQYFSHNFIITYKGVARGVEFSSHNGIGIEKTVGVAFWHHGCAALRNLLIFAI